MWKRIQNQYPVGDDNVEERKKGSREEFGQFRQDTNKPQDS